MQYRTLPYRQLRLSMLAFATCAKDEAESGSVSTEYYGSVGHSEREWKRYWNSPSGERRFAKWGGGEDREGGRKGTIPADHGMSTAAPKPSARRVRHRCQVAPGHPLYISRQIIRLGVSSLIRDVSPGLYEDKLCLAIGKSPNPINWSVPRLRRSLFILWGSHSLRLA